jgi:hypothetical protein
VMLGGCQPCITAGNILLNLKAQRDVSHPGKIRIYQTAFMNGNTCQEMTDWANDNNFTANTQFRDGQFEVGYYGGMGMPTTVILSGTDHKVWYSHQGSLSSASDQAAFLTGLDSALAGSMGVQSNNGVKGLTYGPNPSRNVMNFSASERVIKYSVSSIEGKVLRQNVTNNAIAGASQTVNLQGLPSGLLLIELQGEKGSRSVIQIMHLADGE